MIQAILYFIMRNLITSDNLNIKALRQLFINKEDIEVIAQMLQDNKKLLKPSIRTLNLIPILNRQIQRIEKYDDNQSKSYLPLELQNVAFPSLTELTAKYIQINRTKCVTVKIPQEAEEKVKNSSDSYTLKPITLCNESELNDLFTFLANICNADEDIGKIKDKLGRNLLHILVCYQASFSLIKKCLNMDKNLLTAVDFEGNTPVHYAAGYSNSEIFRYLIDNFLKVNGDAIDSSNNMGKTFVHFAAEGCSLDILKELVNQGANLALADQDGTTVIHYAASSGSLPMLEYLISHIGDSFLDRPNHYGETPLYYLLINKKISGEITDNQIKEQYEIMGRFFLDKDVSLYSRSIRSRDTILDLIAGSQGRQFFISSPQTNLTSLAEYAIVKETKSIYSSLPTFLTTPALAYTAFRFFSLLIKILPELPGAPATALFLMQCMASLGLEDMPAGSQKEACEEVPSLIYPIMSLIFLCILHNIPLSAIPRETPAQPAEPPATEDNESNTSLEM